MKDYKHLASFNKKNKKYNNLPVLNARGYSRGNPSRKKNLLNTYKIKFYLVFFFMIGFSFVYLYYQTHYNQSSIFYEITQIIKKRFPEKNVSKSIQNLENDISKLVKPQKTNDSLLKIQSTQKNNIQRKESLYYIKTNNNQITFSPLQTTFQSDKIKYFTVVLNTMIKNSKLNNPFKKNTRVIDTWIENRVLIVNFNHHFEYSRFGDKGIEIQIQLVLWNIFKSQGGIAEKIEAVSFLIEGKRKTYIGGEGTQINPFYEKKDLKNQISIRA